MKEEANDKKRWYRKEGVTGLTGLASGQRTCRSHEGAYPPCHHPIMHPDIMVESKGGAARHAALALSHPPTRPHSSPDRAAIIPFTRGKAGSPIERIHPLSTLLAVLSRQRPPMTCILMSLLAAPNSNEIRHHRTFRVSVQGVCLVYPGCPPPPPPFEF